MFYSLAEVPMFGFCWRSSCKIFGGIGCCLVFGAGLFTTGGVISGFGSLRRSKGKTWLTH